MEYFNDLFNGEVDKGEQTTIFQATEPLKNQEVTRTPRSNEAPGVDKVSTELLRTGGDETVKTNLC